MRFDDIELAQQLMATVKQRLPGGAEAYVRAAEEQRAHLVDAWRRANPAAAAEKSAAFHPLIPMDRDLWWDEDAAADQPHEYWHNDVYTVSVRRHDEDPVFGTYGGMIQLGISSLDGTARHDWRDLQAIKNQLVGAECEAFELYPAESRLLDPSNYYTLWCFPGVRRLKIGVNERRVRTAAEALAPQRDFDAGSQR
jgi:hypothetical protein